MKACTSLRAGLLPALLLLLAACGRGGEAYSRIHDARLGADGSDIALLVESGTRELSGSSFSATWTYRPTALAVWRLTRASGTLAVDRELPLPDDFNGARSPPRLDAAAGLAPEPLPRCSSAFDTCAVARAPQPFLVRDVSSGIDIGLQLIDAASGVSVRVMDGRPGAEAWTLRDGAALATAAATAMRASLARLVAAAEKQLAQSLAASGDYPRERGPTIIDSAVSAGHGSLYAEYYLDAGGVIVARVAEGDGPAARLRFAPSSARKADGLPASYTCETDSAAAIDWWPECKLGVAAERLDPELAYVMSRSAELRRAAAADAGFQAARRGVSYAVRHNDVAARQVWLGCAGLPASRVGGCDRAQGDTACSVTLPLLCALGSQVGPGQGGDASAQVGVAATVPVSGASIASIAAADARCAADFGAGWRLLRADEHEESFVGAGNIEAVSRLWVDVADPPAANCWTR